MAKRTLVTCDVCLTETEEAVSLELSWGHDGRDNDDPITISDICPACLARAQAALRPRERPSPRRKKEKEEAT